MDWPSDDDRRQHSPQLEAPARNWLDLPRDVAAAILRRVGVVDILTSVQHVCTTWRGICREPSMWRHVDMLILKDRDVLIDYVSLCRRAVDLSQGGLVGIGISYFADDNLLLYIAERSSQLKHLELASCYILSDEVLASVAGKVPLLEELVLSHYKASLEIIEAFGSCCPLLKTFKMNWAGCIDGEELQHDEEARAIAKYMPGLVHLQMYGSLLTNAGLEAIMDACPHLESVDLRQCYNLKLSGQLGKACAERIKDLRLPHYPRADWQYLDGDEYDEWGRLVQYYDYLNDSDTSDYEYEDYDYSSVEELDFDIYAEICKCFVGNFLWLCLFAGTVLHFWMFEPRQL